MQICTGTGPMMIGGKQKPKPAPAPNGAGVVVDERRVLAHQNAEDLAGVAEEREGQSADAERRAAADALGGRVFAMAYGPPSLGKLVDEVLPTCWRRRDPLAGLLRVSAGSRGAVRRDAEAAALAAAQRDQQVAVRRAAC